MTCPNCKLAVEETADQAIAGGSAVCTGMFVAWGGIFGMILAPYLIPVTIAGTIWTVVRKVACPSCGHRFNLWQAGS